MMGVITWRFKFMERLSLTVQVSPSWGTHGSGIHRISVVQSPPSSPGLRPLASPSISSSSPSGRFRRSFQNHPKILWSYIVASITAKTHRFITYRQQIPFLRSHPMARINAKRSIQSRVTYQDVQSSGFYHGNHGVYPGNHLG